MKDLTAHRSSEGGAIAYFDSRFLRDSVRSELMISLVIDNEL